MAVFLTVLGAGIIGILEVLGVLGYILWGVWNSHLEKLEAIRREKEERDSRFDKPTDAWKAAVALENVPRCTYCMDAGLGDLAIGHTVTDSNGIVTCPVLLERNKTVLDKKKAKYSSQNADNIVSELQTREEASLSKPSVDMVEEMIIYDPYAMRKQDD